MKVGAAGCWLSAFDEIPTRPSLSLLDVCDIHRYTAVQQYCCTGNAQPDRCPAVPYTVHHWSLRAYGKLNIVQEQARCRRLRAQQYLIRCVPGR